MTSAVLIFLEKVDNQKQICSLVSSLLLLEQEEQMLFKREILHNINYYFSSKMSCILFC